MSLPTRSHHHHNSRRFRCVCGQLHRWGSNSTPAHECSTLQIQCPCGVIHEKLRRNFRGEGR